MNWEIAKTDARSTDGYNKTVEIMNLHKGFQEWQMNSFKSDLNSGVDAKYQAIKKELDASEAKREQQKIDPK